LNWPKYHQTSQKPIENIAKLAEKHLNRPKYTCISQKEAEPAGWLK
jgi:hypothetical protein